MSKIVELITGETEHLGGQLADRVYLKRVELFFGHAIGNMLMAMVGASLLMLVLYAGGVPAERLAVWFVGILAASAFVAVIEKQFSSIVLSIENASVWVRRRMVAGSMVGAAYGISPFLFADSVSMESEMFIFIILSAMVAVSGIGYSVMPGYYVLLNSFTMMPLTVYFLLKWNQNHLVLALTALLWQAVVLAKALKVSASSIKAIELNERLQIESDEHRQTKEQMQHLAYHDTLTGLANRRYFQEAAHKSLSRAERSKGNVGFLVVDLDGFKAINDTYGHSVGDAVLVNVAKKLVLNVRDGDFVARMGGDEFCVVVENIEDKADLNAMAAKLLDAFEPEVTLEGHRLVIRASIGCSLYPDDGNNLEAVLIAADRAMYRVKNAKSREPLVEVD